MVDRSYVEENRQSLERLRNLVERLTDAELDRVLEGGWTVSAMLAHLAFWDRRMLVLMERWRRDGVSESPVDADMINDSMLPLWRAVEPHAALRLALESAEAVDRELEALSDEMIEAIGSSQNWFRFRRAVHRNGHMDMIG